MHDQVEGRGQLDITDLVHIPYASDQSALNLHNFVCLSITEKKRSRRCSMVMFSNSQLA